MTQNQPPRTLPRPKLAAALRHADLRRQNVEAFRTGMLHGQTTAERDRLILSVTRVLAAALAEDFARSGSWLDLQYRLRAQGFALQMNAAGALHLHAWPEDRQLCQVAALDQSLDALCIQYDAPFPGTAAQRPKVRQVKGRAA